LECYQKSKVVTCQPEQKFCYSDTTMFFPNHPVYLSGCTFSCTEEGNRRCCTTDKCNR
uniref:Exactin n=1 Tax=Hemachatus haemachatus TaxID=8626 RepID=3SOKA_HEMHA|nr:RecName: Full=Exactin; AltName: Full=Extrinsic tenase-mediated FX activation inhibitor [Hemachatus haemachatus]